jgi:hypothetical protein
VREREGRKRAGAWAIWVGEKVGRVEEEKKRKKASWARPCGERGKRREGRLGLGHKG